MAWLKFTNFGETTLAEDVTTDETEVDVTDGSVFPASGDFMVVINASDASKREICKCTARSSNTLTLTRAQEGTSQPAQHDNGDPIALVLTGATLEELQSGIDACVTKALFDADSVLAATSDDTPAAITMSAATVLGMISGGHPAALTATQVFYNVLMTVSTESLGNLGATETVNWTTGWQKTGTVDDDTAFTFTDPGVNCMLRLLLTKDATATERNPTWTGGSTSIKWIGGALSSLTTNAGTYVCWFWRTSENNYIGGWGEAE